jgi:hypothetical protein
MIYLAVISLFVAIFVRWFGRSLRKDPRFQGSLHLFGFVSAALLVLSRMADPFTITLGRAEIAHAAFIAMYAAIAWFAPNTQEIMGYDHRNRTVGADPAGWLRRPGFLYAAAATLAFAVLGISQHSEFIYFRF